MIFESKEWALSQIIGNMRFKIMELETQPVNKQLIETIKLEVENHLQIAQRIDGNSIDKISFDISYYTSNSSTIQINPLNDYTLHLMSY